MCSLIPKTEAFIEIKEFYDSNKITSQWKRIIADYDKDDRYE